VLQKDLRMLGLCAVARIGVHDELSIRETLGKEESIDRFPAANHSLVAVDLRLAVRDGSIAVMTVS